MQKLLVSSVAPIGDSSESASVTLIAQAGEEIVAFCFPCTHQAGDRVANHVYALDATQLQAPYFEDWPEDEREQAGRDRLQRTGTFSYRGCGKVVDAREGLVLVCGFLIDFGDVPAGADFVEFEVTRLDLR